MAHGLTYERESKVNTVCLDPRYSSSKHTRGISGHPAYKVSRLRQVDQDAVSAAHSRHRVLRTVGPPSTVTVTHGLTRTSWTWSGHGERPAPPPPSRILGLCRRLEALRPSTAHSTAAYRWNSPLHRLTDSPSANVTGVHILPLLR